MKFRITREYFFLFQAEDGIRDDLVTGVQTCALPICLWRARIRRARTAQNYMDQRTEQLIRQHYLLRLSHDRLEQELIGRPVSMRDAINVLSGLSGAEGDAQSLLNLLSRFSQISVASLVPVRNEVLDPTPIAQLGGERPIHVHDPLVRQSLDSHVLCHVSQSMAEGQQTQYIVVAPMLDLRSEEHTSELQSPDHLVCPLLL